MDDAVPTASLRIGGLVVSRDLRPPERVMGTACDPPGWSGLPCDNDPANGKPSYCGGIGTTVATNKGGCLRAVRSLSTTPVQCCTSYADKANPGKKSTGPCVLTCPAGRTIAAVRFADYGTASGSCGNYAADPKCSASNYTAAITALVSEQCLGKKSCAVDQKDKAAWGDPCHGNQKKRLTLSVLCGAASGHPLPTAVSNEHIFGFGQSVTPGLSAVGTTKFIATYSRTLDTGPSHAPAPFYISLAQDVQTNKSVAHGLFLNTHGYSSFDVGSNTSQEM